MRRAPIVLSLVLGAVVAAVGIWSSTTFRRETFGWTAYAPLSSETYSVPYGPPWWATAMVVAGSLVVGAAITLLVVRRRAR